MGIGLLLPIFCICIVIVLCIRLFKKDISSSNGMVIYKKIILITLLGLIIEILCSYATTIYNTSQLIANVIYKLYLDYLIIWLTVLLSYMFEIVSESKAVKTKKNIQLGLLVLIIISVIVICFLPIELVTKNNFAIRYTKGPAVTFTYIMTSIVIAIMLFLNIKYIKKVQIKYFMPFFAFYFIGAIVIIIQYFYPQLLLMTPTHTLILIIMYFAFENPDVKLAQCEREAKETAIQQSKAKSEFLASMSHELRTPLNAIVGLSEDIESFQKYLPLDVQEDSKDIVNASDTLLELIGSILDISKIESGKLEIVESNYDPKEEIESLVKIQRTKVAEKPLSFNSNISSNIPDVLYGDRLRIKQIINNLISNAIKYTDQGKIDFTCEWDKDKSSLIIKVADTGKGIKDEDKDKLFAKFERLQVEKVSSVQGTGLGLSITKNLIEIMGGTITVDSVYGQGSTFNVIIPQKIGNKEEYEKLKSEQNNLAPRNMNYTGKRILVVDDNPLNIKVLKKAIKQYNFIIDEGENGQIAINKVRSNKYDIILMDILMPLMGGEEALKQIKQIPDFKTPVIALTADAMTGAKEKYVAMGFDDYLPKPFTRDAIAKKLYEILGEGNKTVAAPAPVMPMPLMPPPPPVLEETIAMVDQNQLNNSLQEQAIIVTTGTNESDESEVNVNKTMQMPNQPFMTQVPVMRPMMGPRPVGMMPIMKPMMGPRPIGTAPMMPQPPLPKQNETNNESGEK